MITDQTGTFVMRGVKPAEYRILAWRDVEPDAYLNPVVLDRYIGRAELLNVAASGKSNLVIKAISTEN